MELKAQVTIVVAIQTAIAPMIFALLGRDNRECYRHPLQSAELGPGDYEVLDFGSGGGI